MWLLLAFLSATLLGFYDVFKKEVVKGQCGSACLVPQYALFQSYIPTFHLVVGICPRSAGGYYV